MAQVLCQPVDLDVVAALGSGPRVIDVTRMLRRGARTPTGIDRVERAYVDRLLREQTPVWGLGRWRLGFFLFDQRGLARLVRNVTWTRAFALARHRVPRAALQRFLPRRASYVNLGHTNLTEQIVSAVQAVGGQVSVMVHDTIPLDHPTLQRPETAEKFSRFLRQVARADRVICPSQASAHSLGAHLGQGLKPVVAPLGVTTATAAEEFSLSGPFVLVLGTIEPRKRHDFLLDLWATHGAHWPKLVICGARGWAAPDTLARLDARPAHVIETGALPEPQVAWLLRNAQAVLFPSLAEGFGLPPHEALAYGTPVLCSDLPVLRETLSTGAVFLSPHRNAWINALNSLPPRVAPIAAPSWDDHFKIVLNFI